MVGKQINTKDWWNGLYSHMHRLDWWVNNHSIHHLFPMNLYGQRWYIHCWGSQRTSPHRPKMRLMAFVLGDEETFFFVGKKLLWEMFNNGFDIWTFENCGKKPWTPPKLMGNYTWKQHETTKFHVKLWNTLRFDDWEMLNTSFFPWSFKLCMWIYHEELKWFSQQKWELNQQEGDGALWCH